MINLKARLADAVAACSALHNDAEQVAHEHTARLDAMGAQIHRLMGERDDAARWAIAALERAARLEAQIENLVALNRELG